MRFILRTQAQHSKLRGEKTFSENPDDYAVIIDGPVVGRIYPNPNDPKTWNWFLQSPIGASGYADSLEEAKDELKSRWFFETQKLSNH